MTRRGFESDPLTNSAAGIALVGAFGDEIGHILRANQRLADLLGTPLGALVGTRICRHVHSDNHGDAHVAFQRVMGSPETVYETKARLVAANGRIVHVHALASAIRLRQGTAIVLRVLLLGE